jgi:hypothetical protein
MLKNRLSISGLLLNGQELLPQGLLPFSRADGRASLVASYLLKL